MDGHFVPNITFGPAMCKAVRPHTKLPLDVHLMVERPGDWVNPFRDAGQSRNGLFVLLFLLRREAAHDRAGGAIRLPGLYRK